MVFDRGQPRQGVLLSRTIPRPSQVGTEASWLLAREEVGALGGTRLPLAHLWDMLLTISSLSFWNYVPNAAPPASAGQCSLVFTEGQHR